MLSRSRLRVAVLAAVCCALSNGDASGQQARREWVWPPWARKQPLREVAYPELAISPAWLQPRLQTSDLLLVDIRSASMVAAGHIPGAIAWPAEVTSLALAAQAGESGSVQLPDLPLAGEGRSTVVVIGEKDAPAAAASACWRLARMGGCEVRLLDGGMDAWIAAGGRVEAGAAPVAPLRSAGGIAASAFDADVAYLRERFARPGFEILDARGDAAWHGAEPVARASAAEQPTAATERTGHVPHGLPFDPSAYLDADGTLPPPHELRGRLADLGPRPGTYVDLEAEFLVYDQGDMQQAALAWLLLRAAGIESVRVLVGGWAAWEQDPASPVVRIVDSNEVLRLLSAEPAAFAHDRPPETFLLLDVRNDDEHAQGHLPGAVSLPSHRFAAEFDAVVARDWPQADPARTPIVVYCYGSTCIRSRICTSVAAQRGFRDLRWYREGMDGWKAAGGTVRAAGGASQGGR